MVNIPVWAVLITVWITLGLITAVWMARRGHRDPTWLFIAVVFGPVLAVLASERVQRRPKLLARMESGRRRPGGLRVLVGVDGSAESRQALELALNVFEPCLGTLVVAEAVDYDTAEVDWRGRTVTAKQRLSAIVDQAGEHPLTCEVLAGPPGQALAQYAQEHAIDVVVVGRHGRGLSKLLLGNVTRYLVERAAVPVLVAGTRPGPSDRQAG